MSPVGPARTTSPSDEARAGGAPVLVIGEALVDVVVRDGADGGGAAAEHVGGSPTNVALGLARLGHPTHLATSIGEDAHGALVAGHLRDGGVALTAGSRHSGRTSTATARLDEGGAATYTFDWVWESALPAPRPGSHTHTGSLATLWPEGSEHIHEAMLAAHATGTTSYDPNLRPGALPTGVDVARGVADLVEVSDVVKASDDDLAALHPGVSVEDIQEEWLSRGPALVVVTLGAKGVSWRHVSGAGGHAPTRAVEVVDTVGAGDSFMAGTISALLDAGLAGERAAADRLRQAGRGELERAIARGLQCAAQTVARAGAYAPSRTELRLSP